MIHRSASQFGTCLLLATAAWLAPACAAAQDLVELVKLVKPAVVRVTTDKMLGSGVVVDDSGLIATNLHVIEGARTVSVSLGTGERVRVLGFLAVDAGRDLALLKTDALKGPHAIKLTEREPQIGERVAAFGNPQGFSFTTSEGIVSALRTGMEVNKALGPRIYGALGYDLLANWVQTTAPISQGNSGGPLVNMDAELIGLNTWHHPGGQNLNFAISCVDIKRIISKGKDATLFDIAMLPNNRTRPLDPSAGDEQQWMKDFKIKLPTGRYFSFGVFVVQLPMARTATIENADGVVVLKHPNGTLYAAADQRAGILNGFTIAQYDNGEPMALVTYFDGKRHGILKSWNEGGEPVLFAEYFKGRPHGFGCLFEEGMLRMITEHLHGEVNWVQLMKDADALQGFADEAAAQKDENAGNLLEKLQEINATLVTNERDFKDQIKEYNRELRKIRSARTALEARRRMLSDLEKRNAANAAFHSALLRRIVNGR